MSDNPFQPLYPSGQNGPAVAPEAAQQQAQEPAANMPPEQFMQVMAALIGEQAKVAQAAIAEMQRATRAIEAVAMMMNAPKEVEIVRDEEGRVIGGRSGSVQ